MSKRCTCFTFLIVLLALAQGGAAYGAFNPLKDPALVGWWACDEGTGTVVADSSPNGRNGTFVNGDPIWVAGIHGSAVELTIPTLIEIPAINITMTEATMAGWMKPYGAQPEWASFIMTRGSATGFNVLADYTLAYHWGDASNTWSWRGTGKVVDNEWTFAAVTVAPSQAIFYVNGVQTGVNAVTHGAVNWNANIYLGGDGTSGQAARRMTGALDDMSLFTRVLTGAEIQAIMKGLSDPALAARPEPADGAIDVPRDVALSWMAGKTAATHDVYFGASYDDVNDATQPAASQAETTFDPEGLLEFEQTHYWRIDETDANGVTYKGEVWSFTVEPFAYPIANVKATSASTNQTGMGPQNTVNGSGLNEYDEHDVTLQNMWVATSTMPHVIQFELDKAYKLDEMWVWNANSQLEPVMGFGAKTVAIEYSTDGETWTPLEGVPEFAQGTSEPGYTANTKVDFAGAVAKYVRLTITANWGGVTPQVSLSEVRFYQVPVQAREPDPADDATEVALGTTLNWRPGREATSHEVYFGTDANAVAEGAVAAETVTDHRYTPTAMDFGTPYYWRVDEVGDAGTYAGDLWSFTAQEFAPADDFESYNDDIEAETTIWQTWTDGVTTKASGSQVGYTDSPFAETAIVHGGKQSMPFAYDNATEFFFSEAEREFDPVQNWTGNGADEVCLWVRGRPALTPVPVTETAGKIALTGGGADIWGASDQFTFAYKTLTGNGTIGARVVSTGTGTQTWAKGGAMIRDNLRGGSASAQMVLTANSDGAAGNGAVFQNRAAADLDMSANDATSNATSVAAVAPPYWVKVERSADMFTGYISADGKTWATVGTQVVTMEDPVCIGLCVTSHLAGEERTFEFDNITTTGAVTGAWQGVVIASADYNVAANMHLLIQDSGGKNATATNADIVTVADWTRWVIPMSDFAGVNFSKVKKMVITIGDKTATTAGGTGMVFIDDIGFGSTVDQ
ncbi:MAG: LamG-like jellyroll fold domain-containing protein [Phycisphaerales bacterium]